MGEWHPYGNPNAGSGSKSTARAEVLKHDHPMVFGRKQPGCKRCEELSAGAAPRSRSMGVLEHERRNPVTRMSDSAWAAKLKGGT